jgi:hypothetical protein
MARERKKKDIPESNQKRRKKENIFDIWSTFSSFSEEKKVKLIHFWIDRATLHFFFSVVLSWFCCLWREKINPTENEETRERRATKRKLYTTPSSSVTIAGLIGEQQTAPEASDDDDNDEEQDDDDDEEEDNAFSSSRVSSVFLFRDHFRVWRRTTIKTTTTTTETRITER